jgi:hypothetical protein
MFFVLSPSLSNIHANLLKLVAHLEEDSDYKDIEGELYCR